MQQLTLPKPLFRVGRKPPPNERQQRRIELRWGIVTLVAVLVAATGIAVLSLVRTGVSTYTAYLGDAAALRVGDEVRTAGITVGEVRSLDLESNRVRMTFTVDKDVFVGQETTLDVRMLTIVGGHYLALLPAGTQPLGTRPIPADRVVLPYSLTRLFQDAVTPVDQIDGDTLRRNFGALTTAVDGSPDGFRRMLTAVDSIVGMLNKQNSDVSRALGVADEYLSALAANKAVLGRLITKFRLLETLVADNKVAVGASLNDLAAVVSQAAPIARLWTAELKPLAAPVADAAARLGELGAKLGDLLESIRAFGSRLLPLATVQGLSADQSATTISAPALCIPIPGRGC
ncbi:MlaD family protein [Nocardia sp. CA-136227]|uniref:MlaD family protein n=1 Tax=Nocardia sp. CA-136227 TaxID=3239979 RepID=UPI003D995120